MNYYLEIRALADSEVTTPAILKSIICVVHNALLQVGYGDIGLSFPEANRDLGSLVRLHGTKERLGQLLENCILRGLEPWVNISVPKEVPDVTEFISVRRIQPKMTAARLRRAVRRGTIDTEQAEEMLEQRKEVRRPFVMLDSRSTSQRYPLFIKQEKGLKKHVIGKFNAFGLSTSATVPWF